MTSVRNLVPKVTVDTTDVSDMCTDVTIRREAPWEIGRLPIAATGTIRLIDDGTLTYSRDDTNLIHPGQTVTIEADEGGGTETTVLTAFIERATRRRTPAGLEVVDIDVNDGTNRFLRHIYIHGSTAAVGSGESTGARLGRIFDLADPAIASAQRDFDTGLSTHLILLLTTTGRRISQMIERTLISEGGWLYVEADGTWRALARNTTFTSAHTFGDRSTDTLRHNGASMVYDADETFNHFNLYRNASGLPTEERTNTASIAQIGKRTWVPPTQIAPGEAAAVFMDNATDHDEVADHIENELIDATLIGSMTLNAGRATNIATRIANMDLFDTITVVADFDTGAVTQVSRVHQLRHTWQAGAPWILEVGLRGIP